jgi:hypothetical protein
MPHDAICFTCLHAIGSEDATSLYCTLRGKACMRKCASYEREVGADLPDWLADRDKRNTAAIMMHVAVPKLTREDKRDIREARQ